MDLIKDGRTLKTLKESFGLSGLPCQVSAYFYALMFLCYIVRHTVSLHSPSADYVAEHWKEDDIYGAQFLNGVNPNVIKRCSELPRNFPVTNEMVKSFLAQGSSLQHEMKVRRSTRYPFSPFGEKLFQNHLYSDP